MRIPSALVLSLFVLIAGQAVSEEDRVIPSQEMVMVPVSPVGKSITIRLEGTERESQLLDQVQVMLQDLLNAATLKTETMLVPESLAYGGHTITPAPVKRAIVVKLNSDSAQPSVRVNLAIADEDKPDTERAAKVLFYNPNDPQLFQDSLRAYLSETLNLNIPPLHVRVAPLPVTPAIISPAADTFPAVASRAGQAPTFSLSFKAASGREAQALADIENFVRNFLEHAQSRSAAPEYTSYIEFKAEWDAAELFMNVRVSIDSGSAPPRLGNFRYDPDSPQYFEEEARRYLSQALDLDTASP